MFFWGGSDTIRLTVLREIEELGGEMVDAHTSHYRECTTQLIRFWPLLVLRPVISPPAAVGGQLFPNPFLEFELELGVVNRGALGQQPR